jgi:predicted AAA+ superfamily ATPase
MPAQSLKNAIITWLKEYPYWMQYAGSHLLEGSPLTKELIDHTYQLFLEDAELIEPSIEREEIVFVEEPEEVNATDILKITEIKEIIGVNALSSGQVISISDQLTIIYGGNGSGKSGYIRMMNNAFKGRGDKEMLPNVFVATTSTQPSCVFTFQSTDAPFELKFPDDRLNEAFTHFSVFDTQCVKVHLENENSLT